MRQIGHVRDLVMAAERVGKLKSANPPGRRDYRAFRDVNAGRDAYTLARLTADGEAAERNGLVSDGKEVMTGTAVRVWKGYEMRS